MKTIARLLLATALVLSGSGCAKTDWIDRTLVTVDVTGTWYGAFGAGIGAGARDVLFELEQTGSTVKGVMRFPTGTSAIGYSGARPGPIEGTVAGDVFRFRQLNGDVQGEVTVSGEEMNGQATLIGNRSISLRRVDPSSPPASPPR